MGLKEYQKRYKQTVRGVPEAHPLPSTGLRYECAFGRYAVPDEIVQNTLWVRDLHPFSAGVPMLDGPDPSKNQNRPFFDWLLSAVRADGWPMESADDLQGFLVGGAD